MKHNHRAKYYFPTLKNQGEKMIPVQSILFPRVLPRAQYIVGTRYTCHVFSGEQKVLQTQRTKPHKLRHYLPGTLQQFVYTCWYCCAQPTRPAAGERRRASDGGRDMYVHSKYSSSITCSNRLHTYFTNCMMCISSGTAMYNQHERWRASEGRRATEGERYICMYTAIQQYLQ